MNKELVEGLEDIAKFFEGVDPPDELDVGADGSSIEEVLMGQSSKIILKQTSLRFNYVKESVTAVKERLTDLFQDEDWNFATMDAKQIAQSVWTTAKQIFSTPQGILGDLFKSEDLDEEFDWEYHEGGLGNFSKSV